MCMTRRLTVSEVLRIEQVIAGDPVTEALVLRYILKECGARSLFFVPPAWATAIAQRPTDFLAKVRKHYVPELSF